MSRIPLSDESADLDDDVVEDEGSPGKEERFDDLDFNEDGARWEPGPDPSTDPFFDDEDQYSDGEWSDDEYTYPPGDE